MHTPKPCGYVIYLSSRAVGFCETEPALGVGASGMLIKPVYDHDTLWRYRHVNPVAQAAPVPATTLDELRKNEPPAQNERFHIGRAMKAYILGADGKTECPYPAGTLERLTFTYGVTDRTAQDVEAQLRGQVKAQNDEIVALKEKLRAVEEAWKEHEKTVNILLGARA